tara:strand:- start:903 stop:3875 length:2973 start_codon:yes stop_codon:yes gene_type:complete
MTSRQPISAAQTITIYLDPKIYACDSIFSNIDVYEHINPYDVFNILKTSKLIEFTSDRYKSGVGSLYPTEKELLQNYLYNHIPELNIIASSFYIPKHKWGRIMPVNYLSMCVFHRPTRHSLCREKYTDLDIVNCHFSIVSEIMGRQGLTNKQIKLYCADPKGIREQVMKHFGCSKDHAKQLFIRLIYGGTFNKWIKDFKIDPKISCLPIVASLESELEPFRKLIYDSNPHIKQDILTANPDAYKGKSEKEINNSIVAFWCQSVERYIQETTITFLCNRYNILVNDIIPCQDGFMVLKTDYKSEMVEAINDYISTAVGLPVKFIDKAFDEAYYIKKAKETYSPIALTNIQDTDFSKTFAAICYNHTPIITTGIDVLEAYYYNGIYWKLSPLHNADLFKDNFDNLERWYTNKLDMQVRILSDYLERNKEVDPKVQKQNEKQNEKLQKLNEKRVKELQKLNEKRVKEQKASIKKRRKEETYIRTQTIKEHKKNISKFEKETSSINKLKIKQNGELTPSQIEQVKNITDTISQLTVAINKLEEPVVEEDIISDIEEDIISDIEEDIEEDTEEDTEEDKTQQINKFVAIASRLTALGSNNIRHLGSNRRREDVVKVFKKDCYVSNIEWNNNKNLFVFEDCVYDCATDTMSEKTTQEDYINMSCGWNYKIKGYSKDNLDKELATATEVIVKFVNSICREVDVPFIMKYMSSFLEGENPDQLGMFWLGKGRNGKGTLCDLLRSAIGNYWGDLDIGYLTNHSKDVDRPNQNLYNCRNSNVLNTSEVSDSNSFGTAVKFISSNFKNLTGQDPIYAREVGTKNNSSFIAGKLLVGTNVMPTFTKLDIALQERIIIAEFPYTFTNDEMKLATYPDIYKEKDVNLKSIFKAHIYRRAFMDLLFKYHIEYKKSFVITDSIRAYTKTYFNSESIQSYLNKFYVAGGSTMLKELKDDFNVFSGKNVTTKNIRDELIDLGYNVNEKRLAGWSKVIEEEEIEEIEEI